jgi:hypothetical protein
VVIAWWLSHVPALIAPDIIFHVVTDATPYELRVPVEDALGGVYAAIAERLGSMGTVSVTIAVRDHGPR